MFSCVEICKALASMDLIQPTFLMEEMQGLRAQYGLAFYRYRYSLTMFSVHYLKI